MESKEWSRDISEEPRDSVREMERCNAKLREQLRVSKQSRERAERDALERAARTCDLIGYDWRDGGMEQKQYAAEYLAATIRALSQASGKEKA